MATIKKIEAMHKRYGINHLHKCGECINLVKRQYGNVYYKCAVYGMSCATSTDWAKKYVACGMFNVEVKPDSHRALSIKEIDNKPLDGQIEFEVQDDT